MDDSHSKLTGPLIGHWAQIPAAVLILLAIITVLLLSVRRSDHEVQRVMHGYLYAVQLRASLDLDEAIRQGQEIASPMEFLRARARQNTHAEFLCERGRVLLNPDRTYWLESPVSPEEWAILIEMTTPMGERIWIGCTNGGLRLETTNASELPEWFTDGVPICDE